MIPAVIIENTFGRGRCFSLVIAQVSAGGLRPQAVIAGDTCHHTPLEHGVQDLCFPLQRKPCHSSNQGSEKNIFADGAKHSLGGPVAESRYDWTGSAGGVVQYRISRCPVEDILARCAYRGPLATSAFSASLPSTLSMLKTSSIQVPSITLWRLNFLKSFLSIAEFRKRKLPRIVARFGFEVPAVRQIFVLEQQQLLMKTNRI